MSDKIITPNAPLTERQIDIVAKIKELLDLALKGEINSVALVGCKKSGFFTAIGGLQAAELNLAFDHLKKQILETVDEVSDERNSRRSIIRN